MKNKNEFEKLTDEQIDEEIEERRDMITQMVGTLYPSILCGEIDTLLELKKDPLRQTKALLEERTKNRPY